MFNFAIYFLINQNILRNSLLTRSDVLMIEHDQPQLKPDKIKDAVTNKKKCIKCIISVCKRPSNVAKCSTTQKSHYTFLVYPSQVGGRSGGVGTQPLENQGLAIKVEILVELLLLKSEFRL